MLIVAKEVKGVRTVVTTIQDDGDIPRAVELATSILSHNRKHINRMLVFVTSGNGSKPLIIRKVRMSWRGKAIVS